MLMKFIKIGDEKVKNVVNVEDDNVQSTWNRSQCSMLLQRISFED